MMEQMNNNMDLKGLKDLYESEDKHCWWTSRQTSLGSVELMDSLLSPLLESNDQVLAKPPPETAAKNIPAPQLSRRPSAVTTRVRSFGSVGSMDRFNIFDSGEFNWDEVFSSNLGLPWQQQRHQQQQQKVTAPRPDYLTSQDRRTPKSSHQGASKSHPGANGVDKWEKIYIGVLGHAKSAPPTPPPRPTTPITKPILPSPPNRTTNNNNAARIYVEITDADVLCQRGTKSRMHPGNIVYRQLVEKNKPYYKSLVHRYEKTKFAHETVKQIQKVYGGRFLQQDKTDAGGGRWYVIPNNVAGRKAGQALRDINTPEYREEKRRRYNKNKKQQQEAAQVFSLMGGLR